MVEHLEYNTERKRLVIPEYGRHIQKMIEDTVQIQDREERNKVAQAIITVMGNLNPHLRDVPDFQHKLWDQLFIISNFELDVDSPYPKPSREALEARPDPLNYPQNFPKYRFYGNNIKRMIDVCNSWEEGDLKTALKYTIANHMKKSFLTWNKDTVEDEVILQHLFELSGGRIQMENFEENLAQTSDLMRVNNKQPHYNKNNANKKKSKGHQKDQRKQSK